MEIKRKLKALDKRMTPEIESMNVANEMDRHCDRISELVDYAEEKIERAKTRGKTLGAIVDDARKADAKKVFDHQKEESDANLADQQEAFDERNKDPGMSTNVDETPGYADERNPAETADELPPPPAPKKKAKKKVAKKKKK